MRKNKQEAIAHFHGLISWWEFQIARAQQNIAELRQGLAQLEQSPDDVTLNLPDLPGDTPMSSQQRKKQRRHA